MEKSRKNIAVIGAGIIGVNCAYQLQKSGHQVTLIDKNGLAQGCSKGNAGHFATEQVFPLADASLLPQLPKMLLDPLGPIALAPSYAHKVLPWFVRFFNNMRPKKFAKNQQALTSLNTTAIAAYEELLAEINATSLLTTNGSFLVFEQSSIRTVEKVAQHYIDAGVAVEVLNGKQARKLEPNLSTNIQFAIFFTRVGHTSNPFILTNTIGEAALKLGAKLEQQTVQTIETNSRNDGEQGFTLAFENPHSDESNSAVESTVKFKQLAMQFDQIIIATGGYSKRLVEQLGYRLPIEVERGYSLDLPINHHCEQAQQLLSRPVASAERKFIMTPMQNHRATDGNAVKKNMLRLSGTVEFAGLDKPANMKRAELLFDHAKAVLTELPSPETDNQSSATAQNEQGNKWMGFRPSLPDSLPVMCEATNHQGLYFCLGHQHLGLTQGAVSGVLMKQLITGEKTAVDLTPFDIKRFN